MTDAQLPLLIGFVVMALASLALYGYGTKQPELRHHTYFHSSVPFIAATSYLAMYLGTGVLQINGAEPLFIGRYCDWAVTTPILLTGLALTALHEHGKSSGFLLSLVVLDVIMILTGLLSALSTGTTAQWVWYLWSCCAFLGVLYLLWGPLKTISAAEGGKTDTIYRGNLVFLTVVWLIYPVVFFVGPQGIKLTDSVTNVWLILVLDITAKVVYGFTSQSKFNNAAQLQPATQSTAHSLSRKRQ